MNASSTKSTVWTSKLNALPQISKQFPHAASIRFYDTTLRDGEQSAGIVLGPEHKLEIAKKLDAMGVGRIEAGFPRVSAEDAEAVRSIAKAGLKAEIWGFARAVRADIDELLKLSLRFSVIEAPTSDIKLKAFSIAPEEVLRRICDGVRYATEAGVHVAFFAVDGTRTELEFLKRVYLAALESGARELVIVDTIGACGPEAAEYLVGQVREWVGPSVPLHWHGHNDFGLATASAIGAIKAGASWIHGTINGMGERAGNADIGEVAAALSLLYGIPVELDLKKIRDLSRYVREVSGYSIEPWKPVVGEKIFIRESGGVVSQFHIPEAIEPYAAELVGATRGIVVGKKSGLVSIDMKCKELGVALSDKSRAPLLSALKQKSINTRRLITDSEFKEMAAQIERGA